MKFWGYEKERTQCAEKNTQERIGANATKIVGAVTDELSSACHGSIDFSRAVSEDKTAAHADAVTEASRKRNRDNCPPFH